VASDAVDGRFPRLPGVAVDATGRLSVRLPDDWRAAAGRWAGPEGAGKPDGPALVVSPDPANWGVDRGLPGAFIWLDRGAGRTPDEFVAGRPHAGCVPAPLRRTRQAGIDWVVAAFACADRRGRLVEAAGTGSAGHGLVYVQVAPPAGGGSAFVDSLLAGVRVLPS
jgi:hypothetical protein